MVQIRTGQILDASEAWTSYTPTISAGSGSFTTTSSSMRWKQVGKNIYISGSITITSVGTGSGVYFTLPATANNTNGMVVFGREDAVNGKTVVGKFASTTLCSLIFYDNSATGGNGHVYRVSGVYEAA